MDFKLTEDGDLAVTDIGDIELTSSIRQAIKSRLQWIHGEWRLIPEMGLSWFEDIFVKNPNIERIRYLVADAIQSVNGVSQATVETVDYDPQKRTLKLIYTCTVSEDTFREEVTLNG